MTPLYEPDKVVDDHGALAGLGDDDHAQYLNEARHDALPQDNPHGVTAAQVGLGVTDTPQFAGLSLGGTKDSLGLLNLKSSTSWGEGGITLQAGGKTARSVLQSLDISGEPWTFFSANMYVNSGLSPVLVDTAKNGLGLVLDARSSYNLLKVFFNAAGGSVETIFSATADGSIMSGSSLGANPAKSNAEFLFDGSTQYLIVKDAAARLGLGTSSPSAPIHINKTANIDAQGGLRITASSNVNAVFQPLDVFGEPWAFFGNNMYVNGLSILQINSARNSWGFVLDGRNSYNLFKLLYQASGGSLTSVAAITAQGELYVGPNLGANPSTANAKFYVDTNGNVNIQGTYKVAGTAGVSGSFTSSDGKTITVTNGIVTSIV